MFEFLGVLDLEMFENHWFKQHYEPSQNKQMPVYTSETEKRSDAGAVMLKTNASSSNRPTLQAYRNIYIIHLRDPVLIIVSLSLLTQPWQFYSPTQIILHSTTMGIMQSKHHTMGMGENDREGHFPL